MSSGRRGIDETIATLEGEGAQQDIAEGDAGAKEGAIPFDVWKGRPAESGEAATYYDRPAIKEPVWIWSVPAYFYAGGAAGAASVLGAVAQTIGRGRLSGLVTKCRRIAAAGTTIGSGLLVYDLGRPERFMNMLRVWRPTSPLNMGSWILAAEGGLSTGAAVLERVAPRVADAAGLASGLIGVPYSGYTAVLVSDTAVPLWQSVNKSLPFLFVASSASSATALLEMSDLDDVEQRVVASLGKVAKVGELVAMSVVEKDASRVERVGRPLRKGVGGSLWRSAKYLTLGSLVLSLLPGKGRTKRWLSAALGTGGAVALRFAIFHAGKLSARDPRATFDMQRAASATKV